MFNLRAGQLGLFSRGLLLIEGDFRQCGCSELHGAVWGEQTTEIATSVLLFSIAGELLWLTVGIGQGLKQREVFFLMCSVCAVCGAGQLGAALGLARFCPQWLLTGMEVLAPILLFPFSLFMFRSVPPLLKVLRASDEIQSLSGQAKLKAN
jgi:hypothetical protein